MSAVVGVSVAGSLIFGALTLLIWMLISSTRVSGLDPEWLKTFSTDYYRPMERLLDEADAEFLKSQPGYEPGLESVLRRERRRVFRAYLRSMAQDFGRLHYALRLLVLHSPQDNPELAKALVVQRLGFVGGLWAVHIRLAMHSLGIGTVDVRALVATLDSMQSELRGALAPGLAAVPAG